MEAIKGCLFYALSALRKLPNFKGVVFRGNNKPELVKKEYIPGREVFWSGFTSTTVDVNVAKQFAGSSGVIFRIKINSGKVIQAFNVVGGENEVLLPSNAGSVVSGDVHIEADGVQYLDMVEKAGKFGW